jgi:rsbT antagonist protein RsbS
LSLETPGAESSARIPLQLSRNCIVASIQVDLTDEVLRRFRADLLEFLQQTGARAVILDLSGLEILDLEEFDALGQTMSMVALMGAQSIVAGMQPGVVSALIELNANVDDIQAVFNLDDAFSLIESQK